jgi:hypothetical protein
VATLLFVVLIAASIVWSLRATRVQPDRVTADSPSPT